MTDNYSEMNSGIRARQRGVSLIETMIAVGILGAITYFVMGMIRNGTAGQKTLQVQDDARTMTDNIAAILADQVACGNTLVTVSPQINPVSGGSVLDIKDSMSHSAYSVGSTYSTKSLKLESIQIGGPGVDPKTGIQKWVPLGTVVPPTGGTAFVQVVWQQVTPGGNSAGPSKISKFFLVNALTMAGGNITSCTAQASSGGGGGGLWTKNSVGNIYNDNTGSGGVGIGTATPTPNSVFDVYAGGHAITVNGTGNVGFGVAAPAYQLHVQAADTAGPFGSNVSLQTSPNGISPVALTYLNATGLMVGQLAIAAQASNYSSQAVAGDVILRAITGNILLATSPNPALDSTERLVITPTGNVGIGVFPPGAPPAYPLDVQGDVQATSFISTSDERLKTNIRTSEGLAKILELRGVRYRWRKDGTDGIGLIAQEVEKVYPELVATNKSNGFKAVRYESLMGPVIEAIKDLYQMCQRALDLMTSDSHRIAALEKSNAEKDAKIADLERRLEVQEHAMKELHATPSRTGNF
jgi:type II secretory pathway pseudopilin PulG